MYSWQLKKPLDAVIFDCDGTLSRIEGIDELAVQNGVGDTVIDLTSDAMTSTGVTSSLYETRLSLVKPTRDQLDALGERYYETRTPDVEQVISQLQAIGKTVFVMSAGLKPAVAIFAKHLNVPEENVFAVDISFDTKGRYKSFDKSSPLTGPGGKGYLVQRLKEQHSLLMHVGDGINDVDAKNFVTRFVGYGGVFYRESILSHSDFYITCRSMAPVLPLALTGEEAARLKGETLALYQKGMSLIAGCEVNLVEREAS